MGYDNTHRARVYVPFRARIAGIDVVPGWYSLYAIPESKQWRIVVNVEAQRWGIPIDAAKDVGSGVVPAERLDETVETLTITLRRGSSTAATMHVEWENTRVRVRIPIDQCRSSSGARRARIRCTAS